MSLSGVENLLGGYYNYFYGEEIFLCVILM